ncbi:MAG TPA: hypothetical protein VIQ02_07505 [Jiangellaceae bacterium]
MSMTVFPTPITKRELEQIQRTNATAATPVVFIHGRWLLRAAGLTGRTSLARPATRR